MCRNTAKGYLGELNDLVTKKGGNNRRALTEYAKSARQSKNPKYIRDLALKNGDGFIKKLDEVDDIFTKIDENSGNKNWTNMIGVGLTSTPKKTLKTLLELYLKHGSTIPPRQENEQITQATGEEKIQKVA